MQKELQSDILNAYSKVKSIRAISRNTGISREKIKAILLKSKRKLLTNDEAVIFANRRNERIPFNGTVEEKAYVYGFVVGDVHVYKRSKFTLRAVTSSTRSYFVELFKSIFEKYGKVNARYVSKEKMWSLSVDLDYASFSFLEGRKCNKLPEWIKEELFFDFMAGLVDAEGSIMLRKAGRYFQYVVRLCGEDGGLLRDIAEVLKRKGYVPSLSRLFKKGHERKWGEKIMRYNADFYQLDIARKKEAIHMLGKLKIRHAEKIKRKKQLVDICRKNVVYWGAVREEVIRLRSLIDKESI